VCVDPIEEVFLKSEPSLPYFIRAFRVIRMLKKKLGARACVLMAQRPAPLPRITSPYIPPFQHSILPPCAFFDLQTFLKERIVFNMNKKYFSFVLIVGLLGGCSTVRQARQAQQETGDALPFGERTTTPQEFALHTGDVLSLADAERFSLAWHPQMVTATQNVVAAQVMVSKAGAGLRPNLSGAVSYDGSRNAASHDRNFDFTSERDFSASLSLTWVLYDFGRTDAAVRGAVADLLAAQEALQATRVSRIFAVRTAYFQLGQAEAQCRVDEENLRQYAELLRQAQLRFNVGTGRKYDITKARADRSNAMLSLLTASNAVTTARATLNNEMGLGKTVTYALAADSSLPLPESDFDLLFSVAQTNQPTLRSLQAKVTAAMAGVDKTIADLYPKIRASASTAYGIGDFQTLGLGWGLAFLQDLFSAYEKQDNILLGVTALRQARASLAQEEQQVVLSLIEALSTLKTAQQGKVVAEEMEQQSKENLELVKKQFEVGASSILELTDAQVLYTRARSATVSARYSLELAKAGVYATLGKQ
jgi:outer membrane protein TolC